MMKLTVMRAVAMIISIPPPPVTPARPTEYIYWYRDGTTTSSMHNFHFIMDTSKHLKYTTSTIITGRFFGTDDSLRTKILDVFQTAS